MIKLLGKSNFKKFLEEKDKRDIGMDIIEQASQLDP